MISSRLQLCYNSRYSNYEKNIAIKIKMADHNIISYILFRLGYCTDCTDFGPFFFFFFLFHGVEWMIFVGVLAIGRKIAWEQCSCDCPSWLIFGT